MAFIVAAVLTTIVIGVPVTLAIDREQHGTALLGLSWLYGAGCVWAALSLISLAHVRWTALSTTALLVAFSAILWGVVLKSGRHLTAATAATAEWSWPSILIDLATAFSLLTYTMYATVAPVWSWDFWAIWGLKGRIFFENGGIDWRFLRSPFNDFAHPDYPLLVPMNYAYAALLNGKWDDRWMGLVWAAFSIAAVMVVRSLAAREVPPLFAALIGLATASAAFSRYVGLADGPLVAYAGVAILMIRRFLRSGDDVSIRHGAILLGLAASTKNEGVALFATVVMAMLIHEYTAARATPSSPAPSRMLHALWRLWPALAIALPWLILRTAAHLQTDLARGSFISRTLARAGALVPIFAALLRMMPDPWFWTLILVGVVLMTAEARVAERFVFAAVIIQLFWYIVIYFGTPLDIAFHIGTSWPRVVRHVQVPFLFVVMIALAQAASGRETLEHAEARPDLH